MKQASLNTAKIAKNDEFYTQFHDIENEVNGYTSYNPDVFRGKTILCPCDDPQTSQFTKYFALKFQFFGLKKLICTSYAADSKKLPWEPTLFEQNSPQFDASKTASKGKVFILERDITHDGRINDADIEWHYLDGDGSFDSAEVRALRDEADIIITNPPFSKFREFLNWIIGNSQFSILNSQLQKQFLIIGNMNAITYKEVFPLIKENKMWIGTRPFTGGMWMETINDADVDKVDNGKKLKNIPACWFTNLEHGRRHQPLRFNTMQENLDHNRHMRGKTSYDHYDNYDAIDVPFTDAIPVDYDGVMGVPISFLDKYCPEQFEIIGSFNNSKIEDKEVEGYVLSTNTPTIINGVEKLWNGPVVNKQPLYKRICIRFRR